MDAITLLKNDHKTVEQLFKKFEHAGDHAYVEKREIVDRIIEELSKHASIEEQFFYPVSRATVSDVEAITLESMEEHHIVKWLLSELENTEPTDERFTAKVTVLIENVRHHVKEEEEDFFPKVREELGRNALADLGETMEKAKAIAPTHPHPRSPDSPPGNLVVGAVSGVVDRVGDTISGVAQGGVSAVQELIDRILHRKRPLPSPTGSKVARTTAKRVRSETAATVDAAQRATKTAKAGATSTARAAKAGAKGTVTTAKKSARATATTAKRATTTTKRTAAAATKRTVAAAKVK